MGSGGCRTRVRMAGCPSHIPVRRGVKVGSRAGQTQCCHPGHPSLSPRWWGGGVTIPCPQRWPSRFGRRCSPRMSGDGCSGSLMTRTGTRSCQPSGPHWGYWSVTSLPHGGVSLKTAACCENPEAPPLPPLLGSPAGKQPVAVWVCPLSHLEMGKKGRSQRREAPRSCPVAPPAPGRQRCSTAARVRTRSLQKGNWC